MVARRQQPRRGRPPSAAADSGLARIQRARALRVVACPDREPYFRKPQGGGAWQGACVALGRDLASALGAQIQIVETTGDKAMGEVAAGHADLAFILDAWAALPAAIEASAPVFFDWCAIVPQAKFAAKRWSMIDVPQSRIAVENGGLSQAVARRQARQAAITGFTTREEALSAVRSGRSDCFTAPLLVALAARGANPELAAAVVPTPYAPIPVAVAIHDDKDGGLRAAIDAWCDQNRDNGRIRDAILAALAGAGIKPSDLPADLSL